MENGIDYIAFINGSIQTIIGHPLDTLKTWKQSKTSINLNLKSLYRGVSYPFLTNSFVNHIQFNLMDYPFGDIKLNYLATGLFSGLFLTPIEYLKIRRQNKLKINFPKGYGSTLGREMIGCSVYFWCLRNFNKTGINSDFIKGGVAGSLSWVFCYPLDTVKTKIQSDILLKDAIKGPYYKGFSYCLARGFIANALGYYCYVKLKKIIK